MEKNKMFHISSPKDSSDSASLLEITRTHSKTTNKKQLKKLVNIMKAHPDIARGNNKNNKGEVVKIWKEIESKLNAVGPPIKSVSEWKKVWADQKKYMRLKVSQSLIKKEETGGAANKIKFANANEKAIYNLITMTDYVEKPPIKKFGLQRPSPAVETRSVTTFSSSLDESENEKVGEEIEITQRKSIEGPQTKTAKQPIHSVLNHDDIIGEELHIQKELCNTLKTGVEGFKYQQYITQKICTSLDRWYDEQKRYHKNMEELKSKELEEIKRHNVFIEQLRLREIENRYKNRDY